MLAPIKVCRALLMSAPDITALLSAAKTGDGGAWARVVDSMYDELKRIARAQRRQSYGATLNTTGLVHEGYLRIAEWSKQLPNDRAHFLRLSSKVMRQVLCEHARRRLAQKRGGGKVHEELDEELTEELAEARQFVELDEALDALKVTDPDLAQVVECRFFAGLSEAETAEAMDTSLRTVQRLWAQARAKLTDDLNPS
jgi:RNA polymerase sigma factor (TIGR02999 family)